MHAAGDGGPWQGAVALEGLALAFIYALCVLVHTY